HGYVGEGKDPRQPTIAPAPRTGAAPDVERDRGDREEDDHPPVDRADEDEDALDERNEQGNTKPVVAHPPAEAGAAVLDRRRAVHRGNGTASAVPDRDGQQGRARAAERTPGRLRLRTVVEEAVDRRTGSADVGA